MLCPLRVRLTPSNSITTTTAANNAENANLPVLEPIKNIHWNISNVSVFSTTKADIYNFQKIINPMHQLHKIYHRQLSSWHKGQIYICCSWMRSCSSIMFPRLLLSI